MIKHSSHCCRARAACCALPESKRGELTMNVIKKLTLAAAILGGMSVAAAAQNLTIGGSGGANAGSHAGSGSGGASAGSNLGIGANFGLGAGGSGVNGSAGASGSGSGALGMNRPGMSGGQTGSTSKSRGGRTR
jgi:hypothetical protein